VREEIRLTLACVPNKDFDNCFSQGTGMDKASKKRCVFITGGTGYVGKPLVMQLLQRGHEVRSLVRPGSEKRLQPGCTAVTGDALDPNSYAAHIRPADTFVQLVGVSHPNPRRQPSSAAST
jgi:nucleoside-diphosphate-sugar epimerase